jgi:hypothetical protein
MATITFISIGVLVPTIESLMMGSSYIMIGSPSISSLALPLFKLRDRDPLREIFFIDLAEVFPYSLAIGLTQKQSQ